MNHLRVLFVQRPLASLLQVYVEDIVVAFAGDNHDLRAVVVECYYISNRP